MGEFEREKVEGVSYPKGVIYGVDCEAVTSRAQGGSDGGIVVLQITDLRAAPFVGLSKFNKIPFGPGRVPHIFSAWRCIALFGGFLLLFRQLGSRRGE